MLKGFANSTLPLSEQRMYVKSGLASIMLSSKRLMLMEVK